MATISCTTKFNLAVSPKVFAFTDTTDWAGQSIATADVNGCLKIVKNIGGTSVVYYNNTDFSNAGCDIRIAADLANQLPINLPLAANGFPQVGEYTITYTVYNSDTEEFYTQEYTFTYSYLRPIVHISQEADCISPLFTSTDNTNYVITGSTLTLTRQHKLTYPAGSAGTYILNSSATIATSVFYNGTQTTTISSAVEYVFTDGLIVDDLITGSREELVNCRDICSITCCITAFENRMVEMKTSNYDKYLTEYKYQWPEMMGYVGMIKNLAIPCGVNNDKITYYLEQIKKIGNCTDDCCTEADDYSQVVGLGVINVVVESGGEPVEVETVSGSGTVTYIITLSDEFVEKVENSYNTVVAPGAGIGVSVVTNPDGSKTYTVSSTATTTTFVAGSGIEIVEAPTGTYSFINQIAAGNNIGITGTSTLTIAGKKAIVVAGAGITVTPSSEVAGVITYTVSATGGEGETTGDGISQEFAPPLDAGPSVTLVTDADYTIPPGGDGRYQFWFNASINSLDPWETVEASFGFRKNAAAYEVEHVYKGIPPDAIHSIAIMITLDLLEGDTIDVAFNTSPVSSIQINTMGFAWIKVTPP